MNDINERAMRHLKQLSPEKLKGIAETIPYQRAGIAFSRRLLALIHEEVTNSELPAEEQCHMMARALAQAAGVVSAKLGAEGLLLTRKLTQLTVGAVLTVETAEEREQSLCVVEAALDIIDNGEIDIPETIHEEPAVVVGAVLKN